MLSRVARGEHQDRRLIPALPDSTAHLEAIDLGKKHIQYHRVVFSDGDVMEISGYYSSDGGVQASVVVTINATSGNLSRVPVSSLIHSMDHGTYKQQFTLPTGTTSVRISLQSGPGTGVVDFSYPVLRNITKESNGATDPITGV